MEVIDYTHLKLWPQEFVVYPVSMCFHADEDIDDSRLYKNMDIDTLFFLGNDLLCEYFSSGDSIYQQRVLFFKGIV